MGLVARHKQSQSFRNFSVKLSQKLGLFA